MRMRMIQKPGVRGMKEKSQKHALSGADGAKMRNKANMVEGHVDVSTARRKDYA